MLAKRIIPCLDVNNGRVVKGISFKDIKDAGDPVELAEYYSKERADELVFLDITASQEGRGIMKDVVREVARVINIPFTVGGGIRSIEDAREILLNGADKVSINTAAVKKPELIKDLMRLYGRQCVVVAIDAKRRYDSKLWFEVYIYGGKLPTSLDVVEWAKRVERLGAGEILLTSIDNDGKQEGYDLELVRTVSKSVNIPVIASGGCGKPKHMLEVFKYAGADGALAASIFHYRKYTIKGVKRYLLMNGINVRL